MRFYSLVLTLILGVSTLIYAHAALNTVPSNINWSHKNVTILADNQLSATSLPDNVAISGVIGDITDPVANQGLNFTITDASIHDAFMVTATSGNTTVVPNDEAHLAVTHTKDNINLKIVPIGVGYADITVTITSNTATALSISRTIHYAASANSMGTTNTRWYSGRSDASTALALADGNTMLIGDDEAPAQDASGNPLAGGNSLSAYARTASGMPLAVIILDKLQAGLDLNDPNLQTYDDCVAAGYTGIDEHKCRADGEVDLEASFMIGNRVYVAGSHSNSKKGHSRPDRWRFLAVDVTGSGASLRVALIGYYKWLREDLRNWDHSNTHGLGADYFGLTASSAGASGQQPEKSTLDGFAIEGMEASPNNSAAWLGLRAPLVAAPGQGAIAADSASDRTQALIIPITNFNMLAAARGGGSKGSASFGMPIRLDLGGRGIREIRKNAAKQYLIIAGPPDSATGAAPKDFRLYSWDGSVTANGVATNLYQRDTNLATISKPHTECAPEGIATLPLDLNAGGKVDIVSDCGDADFYNDGNAAKALPYNAWKKFRVDQITITALPQGKHW